MFGLEQEVNFSVFLSGLTVCVSGDEELRVKLLKLQLQALVGSGGHAAAERALETFSQVVKGVKKDIIQADFVILYWFSNTLLIFDSLHAKMKSVNTT